MLGAPQTARIGPLHARRAPRAGSSLTLSDLYLCAACRFPRAAFVLMPSPAQCYRPCCEESLAKVTVCWCYYSARSSWCIRARMLEVGRLFAPSPLASPPPSPSPVEGEGIARSGYLECEDLSRFRVQ